MIRLLLLNNFNPVMSHRRVQKKEKATNYCVRFGDSLWSADQLPAQVVNIEVYKEHVLTYVIFWHLKKYQNLSLLCASFQQELSAKSRRDFQTQSYARRGKRQRVIQHTATYACVMRTHCTCDCVHYSESE